MQLKLWILNLTVSVIQTAMHFSSRSITNDDFCQHQLHKQKRVETGVMFSQKMHEKQINQCKHSRGVYVTLFLNKNAKLCMCFGHSFIWQQHFRHQKMGLKLHVFKKWYCSKIMCSAYNHARVFDNLNNNVKQQESSCAGIFLHKMTLPTSGHGMPNAAFQPFLQMRALLVLLCCVNMPLIATRTKMN